jgi:cyclic pyranopterin phosphate synthase
LNVSLDTLDPGRFRELTRRDGVEEVLKALDSAKAAGFDPIKVNAVAIRGFIEHDAVPMARYCRDNGFEMRFIEYMPIGAESWEREKVFFAHELLELLEREVAPLAPSPDYDPRAPAMDFDYADGGGRVGMIASVSRPFCRSCNRVRLTAEGKLRNCLFALDEVDVKPLLRDQADDARLADIIRKNVSEKWEGHEINTARFVKPLRTMHTIGG